MQARQNSRLARKDFCGDVFFFGFPAVWMFVRWGSSFRRLARVVSGLCFEDGCQREKTFGFLISSRIWSEDLIVSLSEFGGTLSECVISDSAASLAFF